MAMEADLGSDIVHHMEENCRMEVMVAHSGKSRSQARCFRSAPSRRIGLSFCTGMAPVPRDRHAQSALCLPFLRKQHLTGNLRNKSAERGWTISHHYMIEVSGATWALPGPDFGSDEIRLEAFKLAKRWTPKGKRIN